MKGKELYKGARDFIDELDLEETDDERNQQAISLAVKLTALLLVDMAESLRRISVKIG